MRKKHLPVIQIVHRNNEKVVIPLPSGKELILQLCCPEGPGNKRFRCCGCEEMHKGCIIFFRPARNTCPMGYCSPYCVLHAMNPDRTYQTKLVG